MSLSFEALKNSAASLPVKAKTLSLLCLVLALTGCFPGGVTSRDYSTFQTYQFEQTYGLGFCADSENVFSAKITRGIDGAMEFSHSVLALVGPNPEKCEDGFPAEQGCFHPKSQPSRMLAQQEADRVSSVFADVNYHKQPDKICRQIAIDPCMIERHAWDDNALSNYVCGSDRLSEEQSTAIRTLLIDLRDGI